MKVVVKSESDNLKDWLRSFPCFPFLFRKAGYEADRLPAENCCYSARTSTLACFIFRFCQPAWCLRELNGVLKTEVLRQIVLARTAVCPGREFSLHSIESSLWPVKVRSCLWGPSHKLILVPDTVMSGFSRQVISSWIATLWKFRLVEAVYHF